MKTISSNNETLKEGVNYRTFPQEKYESPTITCYTAKIGNQYGVSEYYCNSLQELQQCVKRYRFETKQSVQLTDNAAKEFYNY